MQKILAIFAHPDDESFGPGGFLAKKTKTGAEVHLLCMTRGQAGNNETNRNTSEVRTEELQTAAKILGITQVEFFDFKDGCLCNGDIAPLMKTITEKVESLKPDILVTFNLNGVSGHVDHIAVASAVTKVFDETKIAEKLYYFTESKALSDKMQHYFIYFPHGEIREKVDEVVDISDVYDVKIAAMKAHMSQHADVDMLLNNRKDEPQEEYFMVRTLTK
jgi:LmbE family N-acetylglucosaminyl deacetylase